MDTRGEEMSFEKEKKTPSGEVAGARNALYLMIFGVVVAIVARIMGG